MDIYNSDWCSHTQEVRMFAWLCHAPMYRKVVFNLLNSWFRCKGDQVLSFLGWHYTSHSSDSFPLAFFPGLRMDLCSIWQYWPSLLFLPLFCFLLNAKRLLKISVVNHNFFFLLLFTIFGGKKPIFFKSLKYSGKGHMFKLCLFKS